MLEIRLLALRIPSHKIQSIKYLRSVTGMPLKDAKDTVEELAIHSGLLVRLLEPTDPGYRPHGQTSADLKDFDTYFEWEALEEQPLKLRLRLWEVSDRKTGIFRYLVLAQTEEDAQAAYPSIQKQPVDVKEITGPFHSGQVLGKLA